MRLSTPKSEDIANWRQNRQQTSCYSFFFLFLFLLQYKSMAYFLSRIERESLRISSVVIILFTISSVYVLFLSPTSIWFQRDRQEMNYSEMTNHNNNTMSGFWRGNYGKIVFEWSICLWGWETNLQHNVPLENTFIWISIILLWENTWLP